MQILNFIKKLQILRAIYGRASVMLRGIRDGGAKAAEIGDINIARAHNGNTIFNVNHPDNECSGGHYHDSSEIVDHSKVCLTFNSTDWVNNKIEIIATGTPSAGQIGPHLLTNYCLETQIWQNFNNSQKEVYVDVLVDKSNLKITLRKTPRNHFNGRVMIISK